MGYGGVGSALPTGYSALGSGASYAVEAPTDGSFGNWLVTSYAAGAPAGTGWTGYQRTLASLGWSAGDRIAVGFRMKTTANGPQSLLPRVQFNGSAAGAITSTRQGGMYDEQSGAAGADLCVYYEAVLSSGVTGVDTVRLDFTASATAGATPQKMAVQRPIVYNLSKNQFA